MFQQRSERSLLTRFSFLGRRRNYRLVPAAADGGFELAIPREAERAAKIAAEDLDENTWPEGVINYPLQEIQQDRLDNNGKFQIYARGDWIVLGGAQVRRRFHEVYKPITYPASISPPCGHSVKEISDLLNANNLWNDHRCATCGKTYLHGRSFTFNTPLINYRNTQIPTSDS
jgi:hypothetical protein